MSLKTRIQEEIKTAMKAKDKVTLEALRSVKSMILLAETEGGAGKDVDLSEETEMKILTKAAKQRKDSLEIFEREGRADLAEKEKAELKVIERFLPEMLSDDEVEQKVREIIKELGASSMKDMGKVMGKASAALAGQADNKKVAEIVKKELNAAG